MANRTLVVNYLRSAKRAAEAMSTRAATAGAEDYTSIVEHMDASLQLLGESTSPHVAPGATLREHPATAAGSGGARFGSTPPALLVAPDMAARAAKKNAASAEPEADATTDETAGSDISATAAAEELAQEQGVDLTAIEGSGQEGRVLVGDVEDAAAAAAAEAAATEQRLEAAANTGQIDEVSLDAETLSGIAGTKNSVLLERYGNIETVQALTQKLGGEVDADKSPSQQATLLKKAAKARLGELK